MKKNITIFYHGKSFRVSAWHCGFFKEAFGLMFSKREHASALLFNHCRNLSLTALFVFFPFYSLFLDKDFNVVDIKRVSPFTLHISSRKNYEHLLEIPVNREHLSLLRGLVGNRNI